MPTAIAAPVASRAAQLDKATAGQVIDVQWRRGRWIGPAIAGAIIGGAIIAGSRPYGYYGPYDGPYDGPYEYYDGPPPAAYAVPPPPPGRAPRMCWIEAGPNGVSGYWTAC